MFQVLLAHGHPRGALDLRLRQNAVQEKLTAQWLTHALARYGAFERKNFGLDHRCSTLKLRDLNKGYRHDSDGDIGS